MGVFMVLSAVMGGMNKWDMKYLYECIMLVTHSLL